MTIGNVRKRIKKMQKREDKKKKESRKRKRIKKKQKREDKKKENRKRKKNSLSTPHHRTHRISPHSMFTFPQRLTTALHTHIHSSNICTIHTVQVSLTATRCIGSIVYTLL